MAVVRRRFAGRARRSSKFTKREVKRLVRTPQPLTRVSRVLTGGVNGFPEVFRTTLRYQDNFTLQSSSGSAASWIFRLNSLYDPDLSGSGHQPLYFDQITPIYSSYRVRYARLNVVFLPLTDDTEITTVGPYQVGLTANASGSFSTNISTIGEQNNSKSALLARDKSAIPVSLSTTFTPQRDLGVSVEDNDVSAAYNANPTKSYYAAIYSGDLNLSNGSVKALVTITFDAEFFQQNSMVTS